MEISEKIEQSLKRIVTIIVIILGIFIWYSVVHNHWLFTNVHLPDGKVISEKRTYVYQEDNFYIYANIISSSKKGILIQYDYIYTDGLHLDIENGKMSYRSTFYGLYESKGFNQLEDEEGNVVSATLTRKLKISDSNEKMVFQQKHGMSLL